MQGKLNRVKQMLVACVTWLWIAAFASAEPVSWGQEAEWRTLSSDHFSIHYLPELQDSALQALSIAEAVHADLMPFFGSAPKQRTRMVLTDDVDWSNGWATPLPYPQIRLYASPPESNSSLARYDDWLHLLIRHEYVHILHMELARGGANRSRSILGRWPFSFPHMFSPSMILEGLAVYLETNKEMGVGRLGSSYYEMAMAAEVANGLDDYDQVLVPLRDWPYSKAYLYGAYFVDFLVRKYGEQGIKRYLYALSFELLPYLKIPSAFERAFGVPVEELWESFRRDMESRFKPSGQTFIAGVRLEGPATSQQVLASWQGQLFAYQNNHQDRPALWRYHTDTRPRSKEEGDSGLTSESKSRLTRVKSPVFYEDDLVSLAVARDGSLAYSRRVASVSGTDFGDLFVQTTEGENRQLTREFRVRHLVWLNDQSGLLAGRMVQGRSELHLVSLDGETRLLWRGEPGDVLASFDLSPSGKYLIASMKRAGQSWNLEVFDRQSGRWQAVTQTAEIETDPIWLDDSWLIFSADYSGRFQLYRQAWAPDQSALTSRGQNASTAKDQEALSSEPMGKQRQSAQPITRVQTGAFTPRRLSDNRLVYQAYSADGFELFELDLAAAERESIHITESEPTPVIAYPNQGKPLDLSVADSEPYRFWPSMMPTSWLPTFSFTDNQNQLGAYVWGQDALGRHAFTLGASHNLKYQLTNLALTYLYDTRWQVAAVRSHDYPELANGRVGALQQDAVSIQRLNLLNAFEDSLSVHLSSYYQRDRIVRSIDGVNWRSSGQGLMGAALSFDDRTTFMDSPGVGEGSYSYLVVETNELIESDFYGEVAQASFQQNFDLPGKDGLTLMYQAGQADTEGKPFQLGGWQESTSIFGRTQVGLPGYASGVQYGLGYHFGRLEWRHWLGRVERNWYVWPLGLGDYSFTARAEGAQSWQQDHMQEWLSSVSLQFNVEMILGYRAVVPLVLGVAKGLDDKGETSSYFGFSLPL